MNNKLDFNFLIDENYPQAKLDGQKYIYVLEFHATSQNHSLVLSKVGITQNPMVRIKELKRSLKLQYGYDLKLAYISQPIYNALAVEQHLHTALDLDHSHEFNYDPLNSDGETEYFEATSETILARISQLDLKIDSKPSKNELSPLIKHKESKSKHKIQSIKSTKVLNEVRETLNKQAFGRRNLLLFDLGVETGLKPKELLSLKVKDLKNSPNDLIIYNRVFSQSEDKKQLSSFLKAEIETYLIWLTSEYKNVSDASPAFPSRKDKETDHLTEIGLKLLLKDAMKTLNLQKSWFSTDLCRLNTLSMRKTYGYNLFKDNVSILDIKEVLNQRSIDATKKYIGV